MTNIDLFQFALLLGDIAPSVELLDGRLFLDRSGNGKEALIAAIAKYASVREAQQWINMVPIVDFIDSAVGDWSTDDESLESIADTYRRSWLAIIRDKFGDLPGLSIELLKDAEYGDVILQLKQE